MADLTYWERNKAFDPAISDALHLRLDHGMSWAKIHRRVNTRHDHYPIGFMRKLIDYRIELLEDNE